MVFPITNHLNHDLANPQTWEEFCTAASERLKPTSLFNMGKENTVIGLESHLLSVAGFGVGSLFGMGVAGALVTEAAGMVLLSEFNSKTLNWSDLSKKVFEGIASSGLIYGAWTMASYLAIPLPVKLMMFPAIMTVGSLARDQEDISQYGLALSALDMTLAFLLMGLFGTVFFKGGKQLTQVLTRAGEATPNLQVRLDRQGQITTQRQVNVAGRTDRIEFMAYTHEGYSAKVVLDPSQINKQPNGDAVLVWRDSHKNSWIGVADGVSGSHRGDEAARIALEAAKEKTITTTHFSVDPSEVIREAHEAITRNSSGANSGTTTLQVIKITPQNEAHYALVGDGRSFVYRAHGEIFELFPENSLIHRYMGTRAPGQLGVKESGLIRISEGGQAPINEFFNVAVRVGSTKLNKGDRLLVTTDGLPGVMPEGLRNQPAVSLIEWGSSMIRLAEERQEILWKWVIRRRRFSLRTRRGYYNLAGEIFLTKTLPTPLENNNLTNPHHPLHGWFVKQLETDRIQIAGVGWVGRFEDRFFVYPGQTGGARLKPFDPDNLGVVFAEISGEAKPLPTPPQRTPPASDWDNEGIDQGWDW